MKVLITGADGMLGRTLQHELQGVEVIPTNHKTADITDLSHKLRTYGWPYIKHLHYHRIS